MYIIEDFKMEFVTFILIFINAIFICLLLDIDFVTAFFATPFILLLIFPVIAIEIGIISIIYFFIELYLKDKNRL